MNVNDDAFYECQQQIVGTSSSSASTGTSSSQAMPVATTKKFDSSILLQNTGEIISLKDRNGKKAFERRDDADSNDKTYRSVLTLNIEPKAAAHSPHWKLESGFREIMANSIDAVLGSIKRKAGDPKPQVTFQAEQRPLRGVVKFNELEGIRWCLDIQRVVPSVTAGSRKSKHLPSYIECKSDEQSAAAGGALFRVGIYILNHGGAMPFDAFVASHSNKENAGSETIGGFGYDITTLSAFVCLCICSRLPSLLYVLSCSAADMA